MELKDVLLTLVTATLAAIGYLVRKILTSEAKIALLEQSLNEMKDERNIHDEKVDNMLDELRLDIKNILQKLK